MKPAAAPAAAHMVRAGHTRALLPPPPEAFFPLALVAALAVVFMAFRVGFLLFYLDRLRSVPDFLQIFPLGARFDVMTAASVALPVALALWLLPERVLRFLRPWIRVYAVGALLGALFLELATIGFLDEYDSRPNRLFLEYLTKSREVAETILAQYPLLLAVSLGALVAFGWLAWRATGWLLRD